MRLRAPLATVVRELSKATNLPVDTLLEDAILQWIDIHGSSRDQAIPFKIVTNHHALLSSTRHDGCDS